MSCCVVAFPRSPHTYISIRSRKQKCPSFAISPSKGPCQKPCRQHKICNKILASRTNVKYPPKSGIRTYGSGCLTLRNERLYYTSADSRSTLYSRRGSTYTLFCSKATENSSVAPCCFLCVEQLRGSADYTGCLLQIGTGGFCSSCLPPLQPADLPSSCLFQSEFPSASCRRYQSALAVGLSFRAERVFRESAA